MSLVINTNVASLNSQRQLMQSGNALDQATERLSSGNRINSAKDDAAGLAIANRMTSQIRGLDQAIRNANDGVSMIQTAEGALQEVTNILQRIGELAVQSANEIYNDGDREYLQAEVEQLIEELDRISSSTSFNGQKLLDGTLGKVNLQVGSEANQVMTVEVGAMDAKTLGGEAFADIVGSNVNLAGLTFTGVDVADSDTDRNITINGQAVSAIDLMKAGTVNDVLDVINNAVAGVTASAVTEVVGDTGTGVTGIVGSAGITFTVTGADGNISTFEVSNTDNMESLVDSINAASGGKVKASLNDDGALVLSSNEGASIAAAGADLAATGLTAGPHHASLTLTSDDGKGVSITYDDSDDAAVLGVDIRETAGQITGQAGTASSDVAAGDIVINGVDIGVVAGDADVGDQAAAIATAINAKAGETGVTASVNGDNALVLTSASGKEPTIQLTEDGATASGLQATNALTSFDENVANIDISTAAGAQRAIDTIDRAMTTISETRADLGAINNRLDFTISNLANVSEKTSAARARIMDADFAAETANLSRAQVLQQAATAMLAQANARPQQVLQLLQ